MKEAILKARVNSFIGIMFLGTCALVASLLIWQTAHGYNPLAKVFEARLSGVVEMLDN